MAQKTQIPARERLLKAATSLFSTKGFEGASVREICKVAETGGNMVHHYFGNKKGLYDEILQGFTQNVWQVPTRIVTHAPRNKEHMISLLEIFAEETFEALIAHHQLYDLVVRERMVFATFRETANKLATFIKTGQKAGYIRSEIDAEMVNGFVLDRIGNQVLFAGWIKETSGGDVLGDKDYRMQWLKKNMDMILNGLLS